MSTAGILAAVDFHLDWSDTPSDPAIFDRLGRRSLLTWSFDVLWEAGCRPIVLAAPQPLVADVTAELGARAAVIEATNRRATMLDALTHITADRVVVLDFRHPLAQTEDVHATVGGLDESDACVGAVPVRETLKLVKKGIVVETLDRTEMWQQVMPYAFRAEALTNVYRVSAEADEPEDDVRRIKRLGGKVLIVPVSKRNTRIASRDDLKVAHALLGSDG